MKHITSTALVAGAQNICAEPKLNGFTGMGTLTLQPAFRRVFRRELMAAVNICQRDLGLRPAAVVVLDALLSCLPCKAQDGAELPVNPATLLTVYASNETLCFRARGLTDRQLRRHLDTLEKAGLIVRRDSANGKRFPIMQAGKPIGAFGLDLSPLLARSGELLELAERRQEEADELRGLRAQILRLRAACLELRLDEVTAGFIDSVKNLARRASLTLIEARAIMARLTAVVTQDAGPDEPNPNLSMTQPDPAHEKLELASAPATRFNAPEPARLMTSQPAEPSDLSTALQRFEAAKSQTDAPQTAVKPACDGRNVRHKDHKTESKKRRTAMCETVAWADLSEVSAFYEEPNSDREAIAICVEFGKMLRIGQGTIIDALTTIGIWKVLAFENIIASKVDQILNPEAYLRSAMSSV